MLGRPVRTFEADIGNDLSDYTVGGRTLDLTGVVPGNTLVASISVATQNPVVIEQNGWTRISSIYQETSVTLALFTKVVASTDVEVDFNWGANCYFRIGIAEYEGAFTPVDVAADAAHMGNSNSARGVIPTPTVALDAGIGFALHAIGSSDGRFDTANTTITAGYSDVFSDMHAGGLFRPFVRMIDKAVAGDVSESAEFTSLSGTGRVGVISVMFKQFVPPPIALLDNDSVAWGDTVQVTTSGFSGAVDGISLVTADDHQIPLAYTGSNPYTVTIPDLSALVSSSTQERAGVPFAADFEISCYNSGQESRTSINVAPQDGMQVFEFTSDATGHTDELGYIQSGWSIDDGAVEAGDQIYITDTVDFYGGSGQYSANQLFKYMFFDESESMWKFGEVKEGVLPTIILLGGDVTLAVGGVYVDPGYQAFDDVDGNISSSVVATNDINTAVPGQYYVTYTVDHAAGNSVTLRRSVVVAGDSVGSAIVQSIKNAVAIPDATIFPAVPWAYPLPSGTFIDEGGAPFVVTARALSGNFPRGLQFGANAFSWLAPVVGSYVIEVLASNTLGASESQIFTLNVVAKSVAGSLLVRNAGGVPMVNKQVDWTLQDAWGAAIIASGTEFTDDNGLLHVTVDDLAPGAKMVAVRASDHSTAGEVRLVNFD